MPLYFSSNRERIVGRLVLPCGSSGDRWIQSGAALFLKDK
jgi:hypothetical protein